VDVNITSGKIFDIKIRFKLKKIKHFITMFYLKEFIILDTLSKKEIKFLFPKQLRRDYSNLTL